MAVANEHKLKTIISANLDMQNASEAITQLEQINKASKDVAESLKKVETSMKNIGKGKTSSSTSSTVKAAQNEAKLLKQLYNANLITKDEYDKKMIAKERELMRELKSIEQKEGRESNNFKQKLSEIQAYSKEANKIYNNQYKEIQKQLQQEVKATQQAEKQKLQAVRQAEKETTKVVQDEARSQSSFRQKELNASISDYKKMNSQVINMAKGVKSSFTGNMFDSLLSYGVVQQATMAVQDLGRALVDIQYNTINNQRLMGDWSTELRDNLNNAAFDIAKATGTQVTDAQQIQGAWIRINDEYAKNADLLNTISGLTAKFMNVGEIEDAESAVALLNASLLQLKDNTQTTAQAAEEFLNKWAYMADKTAMGTADEYGTAIARYGTALKNLGGDMDDAIAQASVLADTLAMNGNEAGTALKTFNTYLTRDKTVKLMNEIAESTGDVSFQIADANGQLDDYRTLIGDVARAYQMYKDAGNDLMANKVLDAVGATRRRDVAQALLNATANGDLDNYTEMSASASSDYLEEQNAALMQSLKNQWNELVVSMQQAAMELGNAGILDGITNLIQGANSMFEVFSSLPTPVKEFASTLIMLKTASAGLSKLGEITGITEKLNLAMKSGSQSSRQMAADLASSTQGFVSQQNNMLKSADATTRLTDSYGMAQTMTNDYVNSLKNLDEAYANGNINADTYRSKSLELTAAHESNIRSISALAQENLKEAESELKAAQSKQKSATTSEEKAIADARVSAAEKKVSAAQKEVIASSKLEAQTMKNASNAGKEYANSQTQSATKTKLSLTALKQKLAVLTGVKGAEISASVGAQTFTWAQIASAGASKLATTALVGLKAALGMLFSPLNLIIMAISFLPSLFDGFSKNASDFQAELDETSNELEEVKQRIQELEDARSSRGSLTNGEEAELAYLREKKQLLEESLKIQQQKVNNTMWSEGSDDEESYDKQSASAIKNFENAQRAVENYKSILQSTTKESKNFENAQRNLSRANKENVEAAASLVTEYYELKEMYDSDMFSGEDKTNVGIRLKEMEEYLPTAEKLVKAHGDSEAAALSQAEAIEQLNADLEDYSNTVSELESASNSLQDIWDNHNKNTYFNTDEMYEILQAMPELASSFREVGEGQYESTVPFEELLRQVNDDLYSNKESFIDTALAGTEAYQDIEESANNASDAINKQKDAVQQLTDSQNAIKEAMSNAGLEFDFEKDIKPLTFELNFSGDNAKQQAEQTIGDIRAKIDEVNASDIDPNVKSAQIDYLTNQLGQAILKKQELSQPTFMSIDVSQASGNIATLVSYLQEYQTLKDQIEYNKAIGVDTTEAETELSGLANNIQTLLSSDSTLDIGVEPNTDTFQADLDAAIGENKIEIDADLVVNDDGASEVVNEVKDNIESLPSDKEVKVSVSISGKGDLDTLRSTINNLPAETKATVVYGIKTGTVDSYKPKDKTATVKFSKDSSEPDNYEPDDKSAKVVYSVDSSNITNWIPPNKTATLTYNIKTKGGLGGLFGVNGTAHVNGTASGKAFVGGNWGAKQGGTALVGELGPEIRVNSKTGRWELLGAFGAQFAKINRSDIIFNHLQTEQLLKNGYATSSGGRGKQAFVNGTVSGNAFASGYNSSYKITDDKDVAATIAVKKAAEAAMKAAQAAEAAGENVSDALKEAAENAEKVAKSIEDITSKFINNVEDLQKRIADALKKQYQEEYDAREKLLKKEHEDKLDAIQKEIDALNGDRPEDKQAELEKLKADLAKWQGDNSTLGKAKQKEYMDKIAELEKEIKIDELEKQLEDENERYENSLDSESDGYDSVLAGLDDKMSEENLYTQANEMIKNQQKEQIEALLNKYDQHWDGWATLMGKTAGQIIAEEVGYALNNYKDVTGGTITDQGGHYSDGASLPSSGGGSSNPPAPSRQIGIGTQVNMGNAPIYGQIGGAGYPQYFSNDPVYTVVDMNGDWLLTRWHGLGSGYTGWFKKSDVKSFDTGGYTGLDEGMAMLHAKERVLTAQQTAAFDKLVYNILPKLDKELMSTNLGQSTVINNNGNTFNKELVSVNVDKIINNTPFDIANTEDNLDRVFRQSLKKSGINIKR